MFQNRGMLVLVGVALVAFLAFLVFGGEGSRSSMGRGEAGEDGSRMRAGAAMEEDGPGLGKARREGADPLTRARTKGGGRGGNKAGGEPDPELVKKLNIPENMLVATGPPEAPKPGIVQQNFKGALTVRGGAGSSGTGAAGDRANDEDGESAEDDAASEDDQVDCPQCLGTALRTMVVDLVKQPIFEGAFEQTCSSPFISLGHGEQFRINGDPACVIFVAQSCRGSGSALFDGRFYVTVTGECIPSRQFLKDVLRR